MKITDEVQFASPPEQSHQLVAIMFTDIVDYTALMSRDSVEALKVVRGYADHPGRIR